MNVLVTGGNGFIGKHVCARLVELGHVATVFDRLWAHAEGSYGAYLGNVCDAQAVDQAVYHHDAVIHLAGVLGTQETVANPLPAVETNIVGSLNVFEACARHNKRGVYIAVGNHWMNNPYSISKTTAERFALMYNKERGTKIAVVRGSQRLRAGAEGGAGTKDHPELHHSGLERRTIDGVRRRVSGHGHDLCLRPRRHSL